MNEVLIIGGGAAGLSAAAHAAELGLKAIVFEANSVTGGNGMFAEVMFGVGSREQEKRGIRCDLDGYFRLAMEHSHWKNNARLVRKLLEGSGASIDWLCDHGLKIAGFQDCEVPSLGTGTHFTENVHTGRDSMNILRDFCEKNSNITIYTNARVFSIIIKDERVIGLTALINKKPQSFRGDAVLIACGEFGGNAELMSRIIPGVDPSYFGHKRGIRMNGDGILLAESAGGEIVSDGCLENGGPSFEGSPALKNFAVKQYAIWLNRSGRRFADESIRDNFAYGCNAVYAQPGHICYVLLDDKMVKKAMGEPAEFFAGPAAANQNMSDIQGIIAKETDADMACQSADLAGIAKWIGVPDETLQNEIDEYNKFCMQGRDDVFLKTPEMLVPIGDGPYLCLKCGVNFVLTHGGVRIDEKMRCIRADGSAIPGLYAAGANISGVDSHGYQVSLGGHSFGFSLTGGRLAAESMLEYVEGKVSV
ncbi:MAG: FAD-binding protein [Lachnospiraceae bacterium]|nr:FAD-binding protein [Lachnospiraceae bacterium]